jgi:hypothetical protein
MVFAAICLSLFFAGCGTVPPEGTTTLQLSEADFESDRNGILTINNLSSVDVAIFAGRVERGNYIGAIKANESRAFDLNKIPNIPKKGAFLFRATSYQKLNKNGKVGIKEEDVLFTGLVAYDLDQPDRRIVKDIFSNIDDQQETFVHVSNVTKYVIELRLNGSDGEKVAVLGPGQRNKKLWIKPDPDGLAYRFFPTYIYVNPNTGEMDAFTDVANKSGQRFEPLPAGPSVPVYVFEDPATKPGGKQYNVAFIDLQNDTTQLLSFATARGNYRKNTRGTANTTRGQSDTYEIDSGPSGRTYTGLSVEYDDGWMDLEPVDIVPGHVYNLVVTMMNGNIQYKIFPRGLKSVVEDNRINLFLETEG